MRLQRARRARSRIRRLGENRLSVFRSARHVYAQVFTPQGDRVLASASSLDTTLRGRSGNRETAALVGGLIAERALKAGIERVAFDRSGFRYHGCVRALAEAAREAGLRF